MNDLFILPLPIACIAWTVTHEEIFSEPRNYCIHQSKTAKKLIGRKFFYLFTCEYCFSHYVTLVFVWMVDYHLLFPDWRGYVIGSFALVWITNVYMSLFGWIRVGMKREKIEADMEALQWKATQKPMVAE
jgi:hypothetical protein